MIHNDHLGTPQKMTDGSGVVQWSADYKPFGETLNITGSITNNLRGRGQYFDAESGLIYNYFRDLNPAIGRYIEKDRIGLRGGINLYAFVGDSPVNWFDPYGLRTQAWPDYDPQAGLPNNVTGRDPGNVTNPAGFGPIVVPGMNQNMWGVPATAPLDTPNEGSTLGELITNILTWLWPPSPPSPPSPPAPPSPPSPRSPSPMGCHATR